MALKRPVRYTQSRGKFRRDQRLNTTREFDNPPRGNMKVKPLKWALEPAIFHSMREGKGLETLRKKTFKSNAWELPSLAPSNFNSLKRLTYGSFTPRHITTGRVTTRSGSSSCPQAGQTSGRAVEDWFRCLADQYQVGLARRHEAQGVPVVQYRVVKGPLFRYRC